MIGHQQKDKKQEGAVKLGGIRAVNTKKKINVTDGSDMIIDPELDKFLGDEYLPEKYKRDEIRLLNSHLPNSSSFK